MLKDNIVYYYRDLGKNCAEAIILAANEKYNLGLNEAAIKLFLGFGGGNGCGGTCGALSGALAVLSHLYGDKPQEEFRPLCAKFVERFDAKLGGTECSLLAGKYKTSETRCTAAVELAGEVLDAFIAEQNGETTPAAGPCTLSPADIKRVKGMGFLQHAGTNKFNGRIITRNGRITVDEAKAIANAAEQYGDGYMMLTTRLTLEVSGIDYNDIDAFRAEVGKAGLETGGTGSKVRPVVSCKGTTCQYGLYDTYAISQEIHERFFKGYANVSLPHKFKIATGGCPNNCVKPDLNDLGIVGARMPVFNETLCRNCKKCQIETSCPIKVPVMVNGKPVIDPGACNSCGRCVGKCPFHCTDEFVSGWK
ncbi:MAG: C-GCAxxG-C-C family (seleno)protein, partial [Oscillospiraceae bacterium]|nr:C-GCAxxG-C-C family (seleno)protein [Oscillospiraceae bacterium]